MISAWTWLKEKWHESRKIRRARAAYSWINRLLGWNDWYQWGAALLQTPAGVAAALTTTAAVTTGALVVHNAVIDPASEPYVQTEVAPLQDLAPKPVRQTRSTVIFAIEGKDKQGRRGTFDVVVAKQQFLWVRGSSDELEKDGVVIAGAALAQEFLDGDVRASLLEAKQIISVGTASQEGDPAEETARAARRAKRTAELVSTAIDPATPISTLNLGQFREQCADCNTTGTNWQRPFMVIAVKDLEPDTNTAEALADAMTGKAKLPSPASYSAFELTKVR